MNFKMKQKVYFKLVSIVQIILSIVLIISANYFNGLDIAQLEMYIEDYKECIVDNPEYEDFYLEKIEELQNEVSRLQEDGINEIKIYSVKFILLNIIILIVAQKENIFKNKILIGSISIIGFLMAYSDISKILCFINLIALKLAKREKKEDYSDAKEKLPKIENKKMNLMELLFSILLLIAFFFPVGMFIEIPEASANFAEVIIDIVILIIAIIAFKDKLKSDFNLFKVNVKEYFKYVIPILAVMLVAELIASMIVSIITRTNNKCK